MDKLEQLIYLNNALLCVMPEYKSQSENFLINIDEQKSLLRSLMNIINPSKIEYLSSEFFDIQDKFLKSELDDKRLQLLDNIPSIKDEKQLYLWQGDITSLCVDAIVNAGNSQLLGCFVPHHRCIDNAIHSSSGLQLRQECYSIMLEQGHEEPTGSAKITKAYNLPSKHVIHTVGPIISSQLTENDCNLLESCYKKCLDLAMSKNLESIAFCCISTGEFRFPNHEAGEIAVRTIKNNMNNKIKVVFNVFKETDYKIYKELLK